MPIFDVTSVSPAVSREKERKTKVVQMRRLRVGQARSRDYRRSGAFQPRSTRP